MRKFFFCDLFIIVAAAILMLTSCKPSVPDEYIQQKEMEDILYDYHIADAMSKVVGTDSINMREYRLAVLKKHGVNEADFDSSMVYYMRHTERLHAIYESLAERLNKESVAQGGTASSLGGEIKGDSADIWKDNRTIILNPYATFNKLSYVVSADSSFHKGDQVILDFNAQFIYQEGMRDAVALLSIKFNNDSVASQMIHMSSDTHYFLQIKDNDNIGIKEVRGFFFLTNGNGSDFESKTTLRMMILSNIRLIKLHEKSYSSSSESESKSKNSVDTMNKQSEQPMKGNPSNRMAPNNRQAPIQGMKSELAPSRK